MIKLIASDLDGTLLNGKKEMSPGMPDIIRQLREKDIIFTMASGRTRPSLLEYSKDLPVAMVADNGGTAYLEDGSMLYCGNFSYETAKPVLDLVDRTPYMHTVLIGVKSGYVQTDDPKEHKQFADFFFNHHVEVVPDIRDMFKKDRIVKISISTGSDGSNEEEGIEAVKKVAQDFSVMLSGDGWVDCIAKGASKKTGFKALCDHYGIAPQETIVFGDYLNDFEMLQYSANSYAMANAHPVIKELCTNVTRFSNEEDGVARELARIFELKYTQ